MDNHYDILIIGAGVAGIGMACHLARECPDKKVGILERRHATVVTPHASSDEIIVDEHILGILRSGYVKRDDKGLPRQGKSPNWHVSHDYKKDKAVLRQPVDDVALKWK